MGADSSNVYTEASQIVDATISKLGKKIFLGMPIAVGKPTIILNEFYRRAKEDPKIELTIASALALEKPKWKSDLERRMLEPIVSRLFPDYPDPVYLEDVRRGEFPDNVELRDFFLTPGAFIGNRPVQQDYTSSNFTHVARDLIELGINSAAVMVGKKDFGGKTRYSVGTNGDACADMMLGLEEIRRNGANISFISQVNINMPFMFGTVEADQPFFDCILDNPKNYHQLFGPPHELVSVADYFIGLNASTLVVDDGTIQIGIGSLGDAISYALRMRHQNNPLYKKILSETGISVNFSEFIEKLGGTGPFEKGVYGCTELLTEGFIKLIEADVIKKKVYDNVGIQRLVNEGKIRDGKVTRAALEALLAERAVCHDLLEEDFNTLRKFGIFKENLKFENG
ncbi:MAG TPA: hypothetical protein PLQ76_09850, partial [bacterium]|nr:hypothetical protein [bacterium]